MGPRTCIPIPDDALHLMTALVWWAAGVLSCLLAEAMAFVLLGLWLERWEPGQPSRR